MQSKARIIFAGSPDFAASTLKALLASQHDVVAVLTQPDRPVGRGRKVQFGPVKEAAMAAGLPVLQPSSLSGEDEQRALVDLQPDLLVVVAYGLLLPESVLNIPRVACVNVHASLLPRWRGASPIQTAVLAGDAETGMRGTNCRVVRCHCQPRVYLQRVLACTVGKAPSAAESPGCRSDQSMLAQVLRYFG